MDITQLILDDHAEQRRLFALLDGIGRENVAALASVWRRLRGLLDVHAEAEERFFYPALLKVGLGAADGGSAAAETKDAIKDHNEIRDSVKAVDEHAVGTEKWFAALDDANKANSDHMAEEERQGLADFRRHAALEIRHDLAVNFVAFEADHPAGIEPRDKSPRQFVREHS